MHKYIFVGDRGELVGVRVFAAFGESIELSEQDAEIYIGDEGFPLLPIATFDALKGDSIPQAARMALHELIQTLRAAPANEVNHAELQ